MYQGAVASNRHLSLKAGEVSVAAGTNPNEPGKVESNVVIVNFFLRNLIFLCSVEFFAARLSCFLFLGCSVAGGI